MFTRAFTRLGLLSKPKPEPAEDLPDALIEEPAAALPEEAELAEPAPAVEPAKVEIVNPPKPWTPPAEDPGPEPPEPAEPEPAEPEPQLIKGNISTAKGAPLIFHRPGGEYYDRVKIDESKAERWFESEEEARKAGWRPPR